MTFARSRRQAGESFTRPFAYARRALWRPPAELTCSPGRPQTSSARSACLPSSQSESIITLLVLLCAPAGCFETKTAYVNVSRALSAGRFPCHSGFSLSRSLALWAPVAFEGLPARSISVALAALVSPLFSGPV